jgi:hypothetical protein
MKRAEIITEKCSIPDINYSGKHALYCRQLVNINIRMLIVTLTEEVPIQSYSFLNSDVVNPFIVIVVTVRATDRPTRTSSPIHPGTANQIVPETTHVR